jgi:uncharacterized protein YeaO (DUF488 family)
MYVKSKKKSSNSTLRFWEKRNCLQRDINAPTKDMTIRVKRIYEKPAKADGARILVDRLWPRGVSKDKAQVTLWAKDLAPSKELRSWLHEDPEGRLKDFKKKYTQELKSNRAKIKAVLKPFKSFTLVTSVKDVEHSHIPSLMSFLNKTQG